MKYHEYQPAAAACSWLQVLSSLKIAAWKLQLGNAA